MKKEPWNFFRDLRSQNRVPTRRIEFEGITHRVQSEACCRYLEHETIDRHTVSRWRQRRQLQQLSSPEHKQLSPTLVQKNEDTLEQPSRRSIVFQTQHSVAKPQSLLICPNEGLVVREYRLTLLKVMDALARQHTSTILDVSSWRVVSGNMHALTT